MRRAASGRGVVCLGCVMSEFGKLGVVCIGGTHVRAEALYRNTIQVLDAASSSRHTVSDVHIKREMTHVQQGSLHNRVWALVLPRLRT